MTYAEIHNRIAELRGTALPHRYQLPTEILHAHSWAREEWRQETLWWRELKDEAQRSIWAIESKLHEGARWIEQSPSCEDWVQFAADRAEEEYHAAIARAEMAAEQYVPQHLIW